MIKKSDNNVRILIMSIVGIDKENDFDYYKIKYEQECILKESGINYAILRSTQWHDFVRNIIENNTNNNIINVPKDMKFRTIDSNEVVNKFIKMVNNKNAKGLQQELIGPEILSLEEMVKIYINKFNKYSYKIINSSDNIMYNIFKTGINLGNDKESFICKIIWKEYIDKL